jgi:hypothetical protein
MPAEQRTLTSGALSNGDKFVALCEVDHTPIDSRVRFAIQGDRQANRAFFNVGLLVGMGTALAFPTAEVPTSEAAYVAKVKTAAPEEIVAKATIVMTQDGKERTLQTGTNGFIWLHCRGRHAEAGIAWFKANGSKSDPLNKRPVCTQC